MRTTRIPQLDRPVAVVGFGCWPSSGPGVWTAATDDDSIAAVHRALDLGIDLFDVAPVYGLGHAEEVLGRALAGRRDEVVVATKCGLVWDDAGRVRNDLTARSLHEEIDASLRRLGVDHVDLYQMHWPDPATPIEESMEALLAIRASGKIGHIGVSNFSLELTDQARSVGPVATHQGLMNLLEPDADSYHTIPLDYRARDEVLPYVVGHDMAFLPYSPLMQGLLTDSYDPATVDETDVRRSNPHLFGDAAAGYAASAARLRDFAREIGRPLEQVAVNWLTDQPGMGPVIAGAQDPTQVTAIAGAGDWTFNAEERAALDALLTN